jgi:hypothetical protein
MPIVRKRNSFKPKVETSAVMICTTRLPTYRARKPNCVINFPCEKASADQLGSETFSSEDADVVAYDWARYFGYGPLENLNDPADDVVIYDWPQFYGNRPLNTK